MFDYYLQNDSTQGIRRYLIGQETGERWDKQNKTWTKECADRRSCELTHDTRLAEEQVLNLIK